MNLPCDDEVFPPLILDNRVALLSLSLCLCVKFPVCHLALERRLLMAIYQTGGYQVKPSAVDKVKQAIKEFEVR